jgi:MoxR-vWA-beta-propeller ternary system domain bpX5
VSLAQGSRLALEWLEREPPLAPTGLVALGPDVELLRERLSRLDASVTKHLRGVTANPLAPVGYPLGGGEVLAVLGPHEWLPWSPGVIYLAPDSSVPTLYLPTTQRPTLPASLVLAALTQHFPELRPPLALLPTHCFSLADASPLPAQRTPGREE